MKRQTVYFMMSEFPEGLAVKIGKSNDVRQRLKEIQANTPCLVVLCFAFFGQKECEHALHRHFADDRIHNEWFRYSPKMDAVKLAIMAHLGSVLNAMKFDDFRKILDTLSSPERLHP